MREHADLKAAAWIAALCAALALLLPVEVLSLLFALPLAFFLTGYAITAAIFARQRIEPRQFIVFSLGLSLAVLALGALPLNYLPGGIRAGWWALLLFGVVLGCCRAAALRRPRLGPTPIPWPSPRLNLAQAGLLGAAALALVAAIVLAFTPLSASNAIGYTEMWIQPLEAGGSSGVRVGVGSGEKDDSSYRLQVKFAGGGEVSRQLELEPGQSEVLVVLDETPPAATAASGPIAVSATLFKEDSPEPDVPFRRVSTWIAPPGGSG